MPTKKAMETRRRLLDAALDVMSANGYAGSSMSEIAAAAGVSKGLAYYHFSSKAELAGVLLAEFCESLISRFESIATDAPDGQSALMAMFDEFASFLAENGSHSHFYLSALWRGGGKFAPGDAELENRLVETVASQFERGRAEGRVRPEIDSEFAAITCIGIVLTTAMRYYGDPVVAGPGSAGGAEAANEQSGISATSWGGVAGSGGTVGGETGDEQNGISATSLGEATSEGETADEGGAAGEGAAGGLDHDVYRERVVDFILHACGA